MCAPQVNLLLALSGPALRACRLACLHQSELLLINMLAENICRRVRNGPSNSLAQSTGGSARHMMSISRLGWPTSYCTMYAKLAGLAQQGDGLPNPRQHLHGWTISDRCVLRRAVSLQEYNEKVTLLLTTTCVELYRMLLDSLPPRVGKEGDGRHRGAQSVGRPQEATSSANTYTLLACSTRRQWRLTMVPPHMLIQVVVQLVPLENPVTVGAFLKRWRPQVGIFLVSSAISFCVTLL